MNKDQISLRKAAFDDLELIFQWINDVEVRRASFSQKSISWEEHKNWFLSKLKDSNHKYYLVILNNIPVGQIRFEINGNESKVSVLVEKSHRGTGVGAQIISLGTREIFNTTSVSIIHAYVKTENIASYKSFIKANYVDVGIENIEGIAAHHLILKK